MHTHTHTLCPHKHTLSRPKRGRFGTPRPLSPCQADSNPGACGARVKEQAGPLEVEWPARSSPEAAQASPPGLGQTPRPPHLLQGRRPQHPRLPVRPARGAGPARGGGVGHKVAARGELVRRRRRPAASGRDLARVSALGSSGRAGRLKRAEVGAQGPSRRSLLSAVPAPSAWLSALPRHTAGRRRPLRSGPSAAEHRGARPRGGERRQRSRPGLPGRQLRQSAGADAGGGSAALGYLPARRGAGRREVGPRGRRARGRPLHLPGTTPAAPRALPPPALLPPSPLSQRPRALVPYQVPTCGPRRARARERRPLPREPPLRLAGRAPSAAHEAVETVPSLGSDCAARLPPPPPGRRAWAGMGLSIRPLSA